MTTDWIGLSLQGLAIIIPIGAALVKLSGRVTTLTEKVSQLESRLGGNGEAVPGRCGVHDQRLKTMENQLQRLAGGE